MRRKTSYKREVFIARQPIFTRAQRVFGYELLFRHSIANRFKHPDMVRTAATMIGNGSLTFGFQNLTGSAKAFVNTTRDILVRRYAALLPKEQTALEILEFFEPDRTVTGAGTQLEEAGYCLTLGDFTSIENNRRLKEKNTLIRSFSDERRRNAHTA